MTESIRKFPDLCAKESCSHKPQFVKYRATSPEGYLYNVECHTTHIGKRSLSFFTNDVMVFSIPNNFIVYQVEEHLNDLGLPQEDNAIIKLR